MTDNPSFRTVPVADIDMVNRPNDLHSELNSILLSNFVIVCLEGSGLSTTSNGPDPCLEGRGQRSVIRQGSASYILLNDIDFVFSGALVFRLQTSGLSRFGKVPVDTRFEGSHYSL